MRESDRKKLELGDQRKQGEVNLKLLGCLREPIDKRKMKKNGRDSIVPFVKTYCDLQLVSSSLRPSSIKNPQIFQFKRVIQNIHVIIITSSQNCLMHVHH